MNNSKDITHQVMKTHILRSFKRLYMRKGNDKMHKIMEQIRDKHKIETTHNHLIMDLLELNQRSLYQI